MSTVPNQPAGPPRPAKSARAMLAAIALLTDLPLPWDITFYDDRPSLSLSFTTLADGLRWAEHFGFSTETYVNDRNGYRYLKWAQGDWHGWTLSLQAHDEPPFDGDLDEGQAAALTELTEGDR